MSYRPFLMAMNGSYLVEKIMFVYNIPKILARIHCWPFKIQSYCFPVVYWVQFDCMPRNLRVVPVTKHLLNPPRGLWVSKSNTWLAKMLSLGFHENFTCKEQFLGQNSQKKTWRVNSLIFPMYFFPLINIMV